MAITIVRRLYFYVAAFIGLQMLAAGASDLLGALLEQAIAPQSLGPADQVALRLSTSAALVLIGLPLWAFHWWVVQRGSGRAEERGLALRRLYLYLVLAVAALVGLFNTRDLLAAVLGGQPLGAALSQLPAPLATLIAYAPVWLYHWRVASADRPVAEASGGPATLRRWYMLAIQAASLGLAAYAAVDLLARLIELAQATPIGDTAGTGTAAAGLAAGLAVWLPHHLWACRLLQGPAPLQPDEARSTLRQVYNALVVAATAIAAIGGLTTLIYATLLAGLGGTAWAALLADHPRALALVVVATPLWAYHRRQMTVEARADQSPERGATAERIFGYLMAAVGLAALYFGLGGLLGTLARLVLAPELLGAGWREPLSIYLALAIVALPVYGLTARAVERRAGGSPAEERALARRIYLYAALLFGIVAAVVAAVALVRLAIGALLGAAEPGALAESGRWAGYALIGGGVATIHVLLVRRAGARQPDLGAGLTIVLVAGEPLQAALVAALAHELPGAALRQAGPGEIATALAGADAVIADLAAMLVGPSAGQIQAFGGLRVLLAAPAPGYELVGARANAAALARQAAQRLRGGLAAPKPPARAPIIASGVT
jgi:hypothetical protein